MQQVQRFVFVFEVLFATFTIFKKICKIVIMKWRNRGCDDLIYIAGIYFELFYVADSLGLFSCR